ncbi:MAG: DUF4783 domain-containing protein [Mucilaginibacter sp.]|uniref:DUF4783 domain-containing protein n=1 Tax=Mucilaginibacter sp. L3T2-6 TaxID=3062491 RepID=UPI0026763656|nr:DUF4783 domain-containing protein [Mucilaginibacter sp. L3T2-6]MDO3644505.1 DUF4783 domain-containing protein [Mucilaginibacter sp. L3T2-6]MDV6216957.1 DUF4783 domain-containing protein [Mucilaginibacter sp. L3T2-6]
MKLLYMPVLILLYLLPVTTGPLEKVAELFRQANVAELTKLFAANVEITMQNDENLYSKTQAGIILDKFFSQNKPVSVKVLHKINSSQNYVFGVLILNTQKGPYRIAVTLKQTGGTSELTELRIETEKVK